MFAVARIIAEFVPANWGGWQVSAHTRRASLCTGANYFIWVMLARRFGSTGLIVTLPTAGAAGEAGVVQPWSLDFLASIRLEKVYETLNLVSLVPFGFCVPVPRSCMNFSDFGKLLPAANVYSSDVCGENA